MKKILFPLILVLVCFMIMPILGYVASVAFLVWLGICALPTIYALKGRKLFNEGKTNEAVRLYKKAIKTGRASDKVKLNWAYILLVEGYPEDAQRFFDEIVISKTASSSLKFSAKEYRTIAYCKQNRIKEAMDDAKEMFETQKNSATYALLGYFMNMIKTPPAELLEFCKEAYEYNSDERDIADNYMMALIKNGEYAKAREVGKRVIEENPEFIEGYYRTALCEKELGNKKEARELLEHIPDCKRTYLTTVSQEEMDSLFEEVQDA